MPAPVMPAPSAQGTAAIVGLEIEHRTSEDWLLALPMLVGGSEAATAAALAGAQAQLRLAGRRTTQAAAEILFAGPMCRIDGAAIVLEAPAAHFADKAGAYRGELMVRLASGFRFVSHVVELRLLDGLGWAS
jgi:hypothetical protein